MRARALTESEGFTFIHPFDDPDVIAGQGTVAVELVRQAQQPLDYVFVCCGGGGLLAGCLRGIERCGGYGRCVGEA